MNTRISRLVTKNHHSGGDGKLSSHQSFKVLDTLLIRALLPLEEETTAYREWLGEVLAFSIVSRRKPNQGLIVACVLSLCGAPNSTRLLIEAGVDRALVFSFLSKANSLGQSLEDAQLHYLRRKATESDIASLKVITTTKEQLGHGKLVAQATRTSRYWTRLALTYKENIISHYLRLLYKTSAIISHASGGAVEQDSAFEEAYLAANMAADRFRPDMGVFAGYLGSYLKGSARVAASHALGLAAPGARIHSSDAIQTDPIDDLEIAEVNFDLTDNAILRKVDAVSHDADIRTALLISDVEPPTAVALQVKATPTPPKTPPKIPIRVVTTKAKLQTQRRRALIK